jgi:hypothetical protein
VHALLAATRRTVALPVSIFAAVVIAGPVAIQFAAPARADSPAAAAPTLSFGRAAKIALPANAVAKSSGGLYSVSCLAAGDCVAGGGYTDSHGDFQAMVVSQAHGRWQAATEVKLPAGAAANPNAEVNGVACPAAGECVAVGYYQTTPSSRDEGFIVGQSHGRWTPARRMPLPKDAGPDGSGLYAVTCTGRGSCVAVGYYFDTHGDTHGIVVSEVRGRWGSSTTLTAPSNAVAGSGQFVDAIGCVKAGDCVAAGSYDDNASDPFDYVAVGMIESRGHWQRGVQIRLPRNAATYDSIINSVACLPDGRCVGAGGYDTASSDFAFNVAVSGGKLGSSVEVTAEPPHATRTLFDSISCVNVSLCVGAGGYETTTHLLLALLTIRSNGKWGHAGSVRLPANAGTKSPHAFLYAVSCAADGYCAAGGYYYNSSGVGVPMATAS